MPGLYGNITSNSNVAVGNTIGLYIGSGSVAVLNSAEQLLAILSNNGTVSFTLDPSTGNTKVEAFANAAGLYGNSNVASYLPTYSGALNPSTVTASGLVQAANLVSTGNVTGTYFLGNGALLTGLAATYSNTNVAAYLPVYTGNVGSGAGYIFGNGRNLTGISVNSSVTLTGDVTGTGNTGSNIATTLSTVLANVGTFGNSTLIPQITTDAKGRITNITTIAVATLDNYGNANVANYLANGADPTITLINSNIAGANSAIVTANTNMKTYVDNSIATVNSNVTTANTNMKTYVDNSISTVNGNITTANTNMKTYVDASISTVNGNITTANTDMKTYVDTGLSTKANLSGATFTGNVSVPYISGNGSLLTGIVAANVAGTVGLAQYVTQAAQSNITSVGSSLTVGPFTIGSNSISSTNDTITIDPANAGTTGNVVIQGNLRVTGNIYAVESNIITINDKDLVLANNQTTTLGIDGAGLWLGNVNNAPVVSLTYSYTSDAWTSNRGWSTPASNVTALNFIGNGSTLTNLTGANVSGTVANAAYATSAASAATATTATSATTATTATYVTGLTSANVTTALGYVPLDTNAASTYGNTNVAAYLPTYTGNLTNVNIITANGNITSSNGNIQAINFITSGVNGNISGANFISGNYFVGDGSLLTNITSSYGNTSVANFLANGFGSNTIITTGNITAQNFIGNGANLTSITAANINGTVANATYATNAGSATTATTATYVTGLTSANVTTALGYTPLDTNAASTYGNANVSNFLSNGFGSNTITTTGNITAGNIVAVGGVYSGAVTADHFYGNVSASSVAVDFITAYTGSLSVLSTLNMGTGYGITMDAANLTLGTGNINITTGNVDIGAGYFIGNGSQLTGITGNYGDSNVISLLGAFNGYDINTTGNISVGTLSPNAITAGGVDLDIDVTGSVNVNGNLRVGDNNTTTTISTHGNSDLIIKTHDTATSEANIYLHNGLNGNIDINATGTGRINLVGNVITSDGITAAGNITAQNFIGNGSTLTNLTGANVSGTVPLATTSQYVTGLTSSNVTTALGYTPLDTNAASTYGNANVSNFLANGFGANAITTTGNITAGNLLGIGNDLTLNAVNSEIIMADTYGIQLGINSNLSVPVGNVYVTYGNITTLNGYFIGNGSQLTGITGNYGDSNVVSLLGSFGTNAISWSDGATINPATGNVFLGTNNQGAFGTGATNQNIFSVASQTADVRIVGAHTVTGNSGAQLGAVLVGNLTMGRPNTNNGSRVRPVMVGGGIDTAGYISTLGPTPFSSMSVTQITRIPSTFTVTSLWNTNVGNPGLVSAVSGATNYISLTSADIPVTYGIGVIGGVIIGGNFANSYIENATAFRAEFVNAGANAAAIGNKLVLESTDTAANIKIAGNIVSTQANVVAVGAVYSGNVSALNLITSGNVSAIGADVIGNVTASNYIGNAAVLTSLTGAAAATYGDATTVAQITVDATGRITNISNVTITTTSSAGFNPFLLAGM